MAAIYFNRPMSNMRRAESKEALFRQRKRIMKYLVHSFLKQECCFKAADTFAEEAGLTNEYEICDNIDLDIILQDYCSYYLMRFNKQPVFCKKVEEGRELSAQRERRAPPRRPGPAPASTDLPPPAPLPREHQLEASFTVKQMLLETSLSALAVNEERSLAAFLCQISSDKREHAEMLYRDIVRTSPVKWDDVIGLDNAKSILKECVVYPVKFPDMYTGMLEPWKGVLLHGPPGTGKTMLARAVANESSSTFFNVSCSTIVNKWRGESEKIVRVLFEMASFYKPSIVFMDEVESVASERGAQEHEAGRRLRAQLLAELDGLAAVTGVFFLANTNVPWDLDPAMLRRLEKRIHIPLPDEIMRVALFQKYLKSDSCEVEAKIDYEKLAACTEGYSSCDIKLVCKEVLMAALRNMLPAFDGKKGDYLHKKKVGLDDVMAAIAKTKPVSKVLANRHGKWQNTQGSS